MKNIKLEENVIKFNKTFEDTIEYANARCDDGDYVSALAALDFYAEKPRANSDVYAHMADVYTEIFNYDLAIKYWLEYLVKSPVKYYSDGFNGLGANYYMMGDKNKAAYYFKRQFCYEDADGCVYNDILEDFAESEKVKRRPDLKVITSDPNDEKSKLEEIRRLHDERKFEEIPPVAITLFDSKDEKVKSEALYETAYAYYACDKLKKSLTAVNKLLALGNVNFRSYLLGAYVCAALGYDKKAAEIAQKIADKVADEDDASRHITIIYDFVGEKRAESLAKKYRGEYPYNADVAFCYGMIKYNQGDYKAASKAFTEAYYYSRSFEFTYYRKLAAKAEESGAAPEGKERLPIAPDLPTEEQTRMLGKLADVFENGGSLARVDEKEFEYILDWVTATREDALPLLAMLAYKDGKAKHKFAVKLKLIDDSVSDDTKRDLISVLCDNGETGKVAITFSGYLHFINVEMPEFQKRGQSIFENVYAFALGVCAVASPEETDKLFFGALAMQDAIVRYCNVSKLKAFSVYEIACALCVYSKLDFFNADVKALCNLFSVRELQIRYILNLTEERVW